ncbi:carboxymuconolactone decarboxylase family protein [Paraburkholderia sp. EG286B]|uniref:carboxymuconolactone decarboxylase family protein n=1 Tax=Paraburkholderia sp. EG286B TaxID=3237011 RepID=UPI0034D338AB
MNTTTAFAIAMSFGTGNLSPDDVAAVSPALDHYIKHTIAQDLWHRPGLSARDRSLITVTAVITRNQTVLLDEQLRLALDNGVKPAELSETIAHLAFYAGLGNALTATSVARQVFAERHIGADQLPTVDVIKLPLDEEVEDARAKAVEQMTGPAAPGLVRDTTDVLFRDLWLRPDLQPRDRSLVTVAALISAGQSAQIPYHLNRAMDSGLTREQAQEVISHLAYYAGWPNAFSASAIARDVFDRRDGKK